MGTGAVAGTVALLATMQLYRDQLRKSGAISYETRRSADETGLSEKQLRLLVGVGWARKSDDEKYYDVNRNK